MFRGAGAGIHFFSSGQAWERAFEGAVDFLHQTEGVLLLGPGVGESAKTWLQLRSLRDQPLRLGARVQDWQEWVKGRARLNALEHGHGFRVLNEASRREYFRSILRVLEAAGVFHHLNGLWQEERFFSALLKCVDEARLAGLLEPNAIERAKEMLANGKDAVEREAYDDFWHLLLAFESGMPVHGDGHDYASLLRLAEAPQPSAPAYYLLGFDHLSLLETDLLRTLAGASALYFPLALSNAAIRESVKHKDLVLDHTAHLIVRGLATGFSGVITVGDDGAEGQIPPRRMLSAHAPSEEVRAAAAAGKQFLAGGREVRFVLPRDSFEECNAVFREELGLPRNFHARGVLSHPVARLFFHALELKDRGYEISHGLELAQLLQFTRGKFSRIPALAARAGIRRGLRDWREKGTDPELKEFAALLGELERILPERGHAGAYAEAVKAFAELAGVGELARRSPGLDVEREAHGALAAVLRHAQMLNVSVKGELSFAEWMRELRALLGKARAGETASFAGLSFYSYGEWLPPLPEGGVTMALRWDASALPGRGFSFYLEEGARRKLTDLQLPSQVQEELTFLDGMKRLAARGEVIFSWSNHDGRGKELEPSWIASALPLVRGEWPEVARALAAPDFHAREEVRTLSPEVERFSASLLEVYKECPFRAFALKVLRLEDQVQAASLDLGHLELGSIVHRTLELYYGEHKGKGVAADRRELLLDLCLTQAESEQKIEYFKGNRELLSVQMQRLRRLLLEFLALDQENYDQFPFFRDPDVETKVSGMLGPYRWEGKVDRIDVDEAHKRFLVIDYKTGASTPKSSELEKLGRFQLQMYMDAAAALYPGFEPVGGLYVSLKTGERKQGMVRKEFNRSKKESEGAKYYEFHARTGALKTEEEFAALREASRAEALRLAENIQGGVFDVKPLEEESCKRCEVRPACRIREIGAPARRPWPRVLPDFSGLLEAPTLPPEKSKSAKGFNEEQADALERNDRLVFIEASAGTGKTTVIVEKIRRFLAERLGAGDASYSAAEKFAAISFTEKSAQELKSRVSQALVLEPGMGPRVAAQAIRQISTIHGFCRKILSDFPVEAGISPMARLMDEREAEVVREEAFEEFFLRVPEAARPALEALFGLFPRAKIEGMLRKLLGQRLLLRRDLEKYQLWLKGEGALEGLVEAGNEKEALGHLLVLSDAFQETFDQKKKEKEALDFNDLEALSLKVLSFPHVQEFYRGRFALLLVDEFQDTNSVQRELLEKIARPGWKNLFVVGDAKQSIYRFRAADVSVFQGLRREAELGGDLVTLFRNYRSRRELVDCANRVTESIFPAAGVEAPAFEAVAALSEAGREGGGQVSVVEYGDPTVKLSAEERRLTEAQILVETIRGQLAKGREPGSIAVLLRKIASNEAYLRALTHAGIPFRVGSSKGFYSQSVILDGIALLRAVYGNSNGMALLAVLRSPWVGLDDNKILAWKKLGRDPLAQLRAEDAPLFFAWRGRAAFLSFSELLDEAYRHYPLDRRSHLQTVKFLSILRSMEEEAMTRAEILDRISAWAGWENEEDAMDDSTMPEPGSGGAVQVMTVHSAKGLEFDVTILPDLSSGLQADRSSLRLVPGVGLALKLEEEEKPGAYAAVGEKDKERDLAESKRLLYVAMTRAKEECILLLPKADPEKKEKKRENWAEFLRGAGVKSEGAAAGMIRERAVVKPLPAAGSSAPELSALSETSITELAALQFCGEFHRRKFVQGWDDQVVALWERPKGSFRRARKELTDPDRLRAAELLRSIGIENKERGIALHRVLERAESAELPSGELWLTEAYIAQGVESESAALGELVELDLRLLRRFLGSDLGRELFAPDVQSFPEIPFQWKVGGAVVHGAMDRLIQRADGIWVVVDYKSSILEESRDRYRFQVASYMAAVAAYARGLGEERPRVLGYLVDLYVSQSYPVEVELAEAEDFLREEIQRMKVNYTLTDGELDFTRRGIKAGEHCFSCPYSLHCQIGREFVLAFK